MIRNIRDDDTAAKILKIGEVADKLLRVRLASVCPDVIAAMTDHAVTPTLATYRGRVTNASC